MHPKLQLNNIEDYLKQSEIVLQTAKQIAKDFAMCGEEISFDNAVCKDYKLLNNALLGKVEEICERNMEKFAALLYRIDIPQKQVNEIVNNASLREVYQAFTQLIIIREAKKVIIRNYFSQKS